MSRAQTCSSPRTGVRHVPFSGGGADVKGRACDAHMLVEKRDGTLWALVRAQYGVGESFSHGRGKTWIGDSPSKTVTHVPHTRFSFDGLRRAGFFLSGTTRPTAPSAQTGMEKTRTPR